jgi:PBP1b-binding outer membrane lipoprotein LpoB
MPSSTKSKRVVLLCVLAAVLSGCADYMNRRDSVSARAGNAVEGNLAIQTINPQPPAAFKNRTGG